MEIKTATPEHRQRLRAWCRAHRRFAAEWRAGELGYLPVPNFPIKPMDLEWLSCGAKTRAGTPCKKPALWNGRCRLHGGRSTGPRTAAGKAKSAANGRRPKRKT